MNYISSEEKNNQLIEVCASFSGDQKIIFSDEGNLSTHVYQVHLNYECMICLDSDNVDEFTEKYQQHYGMIDWPTIADDYSGIDVLYDSNIDKHKWYSDWDISSGCIWGYEAVREIKLIKSWEQAWVSK